MENLIIIMMPLVGVNTNNKDMLILLDRTKTEGRVET
jgi:hypothetical protein